MRPPAQTHDQDGRAELGEAHDVEEGAVQRVLVEMERAELEVDDPCGHGEQRRDPFEQPTGAHGTTLSPAC